MGCNDEVGRDIVTMFGGGLGMLRSVSRHGWTVSMSTVSAPQTPEEADNRLLSVLWTCPDGTLELASANGDPGRLILDFPGVARAEISRPDRRVRVRPLIPDLSSHTIDHFVMDILLPRLIAESGALVVHGALVSRGGDGICLIGESGRGKSTLSAALHDAGWGFHGDDALVLHGSGAEITAEASYPSLRLFPDSLEQLFPDPPAGLSPVADYLDKFRLDPGQAAGSCRLRAVLVLGNDDGTGQITARPLSASRLCMTLIGQGFTLNPSDRRAAQGRLTNASAVSAAVPGIELCYPRDYARLPEAIDHISAALDRVLKQAPAEAARKESS